MKRLLLILLLFLSADSMAQIREIKNQPFTKLECACADSISRLYMVESNQDSTVLHRYDTATKIWTRLSSIQQGSFSNLMKLSCQVGPLNSVFVSGIANFNGGYQVMKYEAGSWSSVLNLYDPNINNMGMVYMRLHRINNQVFFTHNADSVFGAKKSFVYRLHNSGPVNLNFNVYSGEYHMSHINDTILLSAGNRIYGLKNGLWSNRVLTGNQNLITGLALKNNRMFISKEGKSQIYWYNYTQADSIPINSRMPELAVNDSFVMMLSRDFDLKYTIALIDPALKVKTGFVFPEPDTLPLRIVNLNNRNFVYYGNNRDIKFGNVNYGKIADITLGSAYKAPALDTLFMGPFVDHNRNDRKDLGEPLIGLQLTELNGYQIFSTSNSQFLRKEVYDNEYFCVSGPSKIKLDSCYIAKFTGSHCGRHFKSKISNDTIWMPYVTETTDATRNIVVNLLSSGPQRLDQPRSVYVKVFREDCDQSTASGSVYVYIDNDAVVTASVPNFTSRQGNRLLYNFSLPAGSTQLIQITMLYPSNKFSYGQTKWVKAEVFNTSNEILIDNQDSIAHFLRYSYDPNAKYSVPDGKVKYGISKIKFHIDFQNMGNDYAHRVRIVDTLNLKIPVYEFKMIGSSHAYKISHKDNVVTWTFDDIYLWPRNLSEEYSKGYIEFEAKIRSELRVGDSIMNNASIYFDNNEPIHTEYAQVKRVDDNSALTETTLSDYLILYPNPGSGIFYLKNEGQNTEVLELYNALGQKVLNFSIESNTTKTLELQTLSPGVYILRSSNGKYLLFEKI